MIEKPTKSGLAVHFFYVTLILLSVIILLATAKWTELPKFTDYLSTAATITSLVLGLLAIIYAYISNDSLSQTTGVVGNAAQEAQTASAKISLLVNSVEELTHGTTKTNESLSLLLDDLKNQLQSLDGTAATLDAQANAIAEVLPEIPKGLQKLEKRFEEFAQAAPSGVDKKKGDVPPKELETLARNCIESSSPAGIFLMHAIYLSKITGKSFVVKGFTKFSNGDYMFGFFIALNSVGLFDYKKSNDSQEITIVSCPDAFSECKKAFETKIERQKKDDIKARWREFLDELDASFLTKDITN